MIKLPANEKSLDYYELILTENCNFRCKYCFDDSFSDRTSCQNNLLDLSKIPDIINFIEETHKENTIPTISFFGGEPTTNWEFIISFISEVNSRKLIYHYSMNTNASLLDVEKVNFLVKNKVNLVISLDGTRDSHNKTRVFKNSEGTWDSIMQKLPLIISKYQAAKLPVSAMMVVDKDNFLELKENYCFLCSLGFIDINILWNYEVSYSEEELNKIRGTLIEMFKIKEFRPYLDIHRRILNKDFRDYKKHPNACLSPESSVTINFQGNLYFCHRLVPKMVDSRNDNLPEYLGNIYEGYTNESYLNFLKKRTDINEFVLENKKCLNCSALEFCKGGCIGAIRNNTEDYNHLDSLCKIQQMIADVFY